jgi:hypothetical protein
MLPQIDKINHFLFLIRQISIVARYVCVSRVMTASKPEAFSVPEIAGLAQSAATSSTAGILRAKMTRYSGVKTI